MIGYQKVTKTIRMALCFIKAEDFRIYGGECMGMTVNLLVYWAVLWNQNRKRN
jgi:hypothetical protein